jgi:hypothetical protein
VEQRLLSLTEEREEDTRLEELRQGRKGRKEASRENTAEHGGPATQSASGTSALSRSCLGYK